MQYYTCVPTPAGSLLLLSDGHTVTGMHWTVFARAPKVAADWVERPLFFKEDLAD